MPSGPAPPPTGTRHLARTHVDACRAVVSAAAERLTAPRCASELHVALHKSVSVLLHREVSRLTHHDVESRTLPRDLQVEVGRWKAALGPDELTPLIEERASQWRDALSELIRRLGDDWPDVVRAFALDPEARLTSVSSPLGDFHNGGRSVYRLGFDDGNDLIYKPRPVDGEYAFGRVVQWLQRLGYAPTLSYCQALPREGYGWTSYIPRRFCSSVEQAMRFYERQGAFLALFVLLRGADCIGDNVVVAGEHPVWVDLECLCSPRLPRQSLIAELPAWMSWMTESVLSTSLVYAAKGEGIDPRSHTGLAVSCLADRSAIFDPDGLLRAPFVGSIKRGFQQTYDWLLGQRAAWTSDAGPLSWWADQPVRVIPRDTGLYMQLSDALRIVPSDQREWLRTTVEDTLVSGWNRAEWLRELMPAEIEAMERGDVPYWTMSARSRDLTAPDGRSVRDVAVRSGVESVYDRAACMSVADRDSQLWLIENFLHLRATS